MTPVILPAAGGADRPLRSHGSKVWTVAFHPSGELVASGDSDGIVRVGSVAGDEPHLLFGHNDAVQEITVHPGGDWLATTSKDRSVRVWPMPRGRPFQTLPHEEFLSRLRSLTSLRVVGDAENPAGYRVNFGSSASRRPFPTRYMLSEVM